MSLCCHFSIAKIERFKKSRILKKNMSKLFNWLLALGLTAGTIFSTAYANPVPANENQNPVNNLLIPQTPQNISQQHNTKRHRVVHGTRWVDTSTNTSKAPKPGDDYFDVWKSGENVCWKGKWSKDESTLEESLNKDLAGIRNYFAIKIAPYQYPMPKALESADSLKNIINTTGWKYGQMQPGLWYSGCIPLSQLIIPKAVIIVPDTIKKPIIVPDTTKPVQEKGNFLIDDLEQGPLYLGTIYRVGQDTAGSFDLLGLMFGGDVRSKGNVRFAASLDAVAASKVAKDGGQTDGNGVGWGRAHALAYNRWMAGGLIAIKDTLNDFYLGPMGSLTVQLGDKIIGNVYGAPLGAKNHNKLSYIIGGTAYFPLTSGLLLKAHGEQGRNPITGQYENLGEFSVRMGSDAKLTAALGFKSPTEVGANEETYDKPLRESAQKIEFFNKLIFEGTGANPIVAEVGTSGRQEKGYFYHVAEAYGKLGIKLGR